MARLTPDAAGLRLHLDADEVDVLVSLVEGLASHIAAASDDPHSDASDRVISRLAPTVSRGDTEVDVELRAMLRDDLLTSRTTRLSALAEDLRAWEESDADADGPAGGGGFDRSLDRDEAMRIVEALNDVRLAIATTVDRPDDGAGAPRDDGEGRSDAARLIDALTWLQGGLIDFVDGGLSDP